MTATFKIDATDLTLQSWPILQRRMRSNATYLEGTGLHQSRRVRGLLECNQETRGYEQVFIYVPKGLSDAVEPSIKIIKSIYNLQGMERNFPLYLAAFGGTDLTVHPKPFKTYAYNRAIRHVVEELLSGSHSSPHYLTTLNLVPVIRHTKIARNDLVIVVVDKIENLVVTEEAKNELQKKNNAHIISVNDDIKGETFKKIQLKPCQTKGENE